MGRPKHYLWVFALAIFIFAVPIVLEPVLGLRKLPAGVPLAAMLGSFLLHFIITLIYGYIWTATQSLAVVSAYYSAYAEGRLPFR